MLQPCEDESLCFTKGLSTFRNRLLISKLQHHEVRMVDMESELLTVS